MPRVCVCVHALVFPVSALVYLELDDILSVDREKRAIYVSVCVINYFSQVQVRHGERNRRGEARPVRLCNILH